MSGKSSPGSIGFLTDFGYTDEFTGVCRAVIKGISPAVEIIDITHGIAPADIRHGAFSLAAYAAYSGPSVLLAVVDPGVGSSRRAVAIRVGDNHLVGPDNGLLMIAADQLGGASDAVEISSTPVRLEPTSRTFHGRDIFGPVAAHLAAGADLGTLGEPVDPAGLVRIDLPEATISDEEIVCHVMISDHYGNLTLNVDASAIGEGMFAKAEAVRVRIASGPTRMRVCASYEDAAEGEAMVYPNSSGAMAIAVNRGNAAERFELGPDDEIRLTPVPL